MAIVSCTAQDFNLECNFQLSGQFGYICNLNGIEVIERGLNVVFGGAHIEDRTNDNVTAVIITNSNTPFVIPEIFTTFVNLDTLEIEDSRLETVSIPDTVSLRRLQVDGNNLTRLVAGFLQSQTNLEYFSAISSNIIEIDEDAFLGLSGLHDLVLPVNHIEQIAPNTFHPLISLQYLDLETNSIASIGENLFSQSPDLHSIYLDHNNINEIAPSLTANFGEGLDFINLVGNECVSRSFHVGTEEDLIMMHNMLRACFSNFSGTNPEEKNFGSEFRGPMRIYDSFGNLIGSV